MHLDINRVRCTGHGVCDALLPERISLDEWGFPILHVATVTDDALPETRRAVAACPALALRLTSAHPG